jgi:transcriptional regulator with XRE-family HTH domain
MNIGHTLRRIRESKNLTQGDIEERTGLMRCYISRVENGHTVPAIESLEKIACALEMPLYQFFYVANDEPPAPPPNHLNGEWGRSGKSARYFHKLVDSLSRMDNAHRLLLFAMAKEAAKRRHGR